MRKLFASRLGLFYPALLLFIFVFSFPATAQILPECERAKLLEEIQGDKFENLLPNLMDRTEIDMWLVIAREYN